MGEPTKPKLGTGAELGANIFAIGFFAFVVIWLG